MYQRGLARAAHARDAHQAIERYVHVDALEVVLLRAFDAQRSGRGGTRGSGRYLDPPAMKQIIGGQRALRLRKRAGPALKDDLTAMLAGTRPDVDQPVGRLHHLGVVLDHDQRVAGIAQPLHHADDAADVACVKTDGGFVEDEQGIHERGAERRGEIDPLHLTSRQGARLTVEIEISESDIGQILEPRTDLVQQEIDGLVERRRQGKLGEKAQISIDGGEHHVADVDAGRSGRADPPQERLRLQPRPPASRAFGVRAVSRQQYPNVHFIRLGLEPGEEASDAVPDVLGPFALSIQDPGALGIGEIAPGCIERNPAFFGESDQIRLTLFVGLRLPGLDRAFPQRQRRIGNDQAVVDADHSSETTAGLTGADGRIETEGARARVLVGDVAVRAMQLGRETPGCAGHPVLALRIDVEASLTDLESRLDGVVRARRLDRGPAESILDHVQDAIALLVNARVALRGEELLDLRLVEILGNRHGEGEQQPRIARGAGTFVESGADGIDGVAAYGPSATPAMQYRRAREQELQVVVELRHGAHGRAGGAHRIRLIDRDRGRDALDGIHHGAIHAIQELPRVRREGLDIPALTLGVQGVEHQRGFSRAADSRYDDQLVDREVEVEILEIVLTRAANADGIRA